MNYFLLGPEEGQKADWLNEEKKRVLSEHPDAEIHQIFVGDDKGEDLDAALSQQSLFSSFRFVIVKQYENRTARDTFDKAITSFLESGMTDAELVVLSAEKSPAKISRKIAENSNVSVIMFWEMFDNQKRGWIKSAFQKEGFFINDEGVEEVLFSVDNNTAEMRNLVSALSVYFHATDKSKHEITPDDIRKYALQTRGEDGNTLFQAIAECDLEHAESILSSIINADSAAAGRAFSAIVQRFRELESYEELKASGEGDESAFSKTEAVSLFSSFYQGKGIKKRDWPVFRKAAAAYPISDTRRIIRYLGNMDTVIKGTGSEWMSMVFSSVLYTIIIRKGKEEDIAIGSSLLDADCIRS